MAQGRLACRAYHDEATWKDELNRVFGPAWLCVGHVDEVPDPGDAVPFATPGGRWLLVRQRDGTVGVLHNVCRHRLGPLLFDDEVQRGGRSLRCRYHGWCYDLQGALTATPGFQTLDKAALGLVAARAEVWHGLVFVNPDGTAPPLRAWLGDLDREPGVALLDGYALHARVQHTLQANWKVYVENYQEGLHVPWMHPGLSAEVDARTYRVRPCGPGVVHEVPTVGPAVNAGFWAWLWPTLAINVYGAGLSVERIVPLGPRSTRIDYLFLFRPDATEQARREAMAMSGEVTAEDVRICEAVQRNLETGGVQPGPLADRHEDGVLAFQERWVTAMGAARGSVSSG